MLRIGTAPSRSSDQASPKPIFVSLGLTKVGKSTLLRRQFPQAARFDLLDTRLMLEFTRAPWTLADRVGALDRSRRTHPVIIDEVQKVPAILDEVQRLIEDERLGFILCGSNARKLERGGPTCSEGGHGASGCIP